MWLFCGGMFRSGSTLQYQIASHLVETLGVGRRVTWHSSEDFVNVRNTNVKSGDELLVVKTHRMSKAIREELDAADGYVVTVHRDIRDVVVSAMRKNNWSFKHIWRHGYIHKWTRHFDEWAEAPNAMVSRYETMTSEIADETKRIAAHVDLSISDELAANIAEQYAIEQNKERVAQVAQWREAGVVEKFDSHSLLHYNHIVSGGVGMFYEVLKPFEIQAIESVCGEWMDRWGYPRTDMSLGVRDHIGRLLLGSGKSRMRRSA